VCAARLVDSSAGLGNSTSLKEPRWDPASRTGHAPPTPLASQRLRIRVGAAWRASIRPDRWITSCCRHLGVADGRAPAGTQRPSVLESAGRNVHVGQLSSSCPMIDHQPRRWPGRLPDKGRRVDSHSGRLKSDSANATPPQDFGAESRRAMASAATGSAVAQDGSATARASMVIGSPSLLTLNALPKSGRSTVTSSLLGRPSCSELMRPITPFT